MEDHRNIKKMKFKNNPNPFYNFFSIVTVQFKNLRKKIPFHKFKKVLYFLFCPAKKIIFSYVPQS